VETLQAGFYLGAAANTSTLGYFYLDVVGYA